MTKRLLKTFVICLLTLSPLMAQSRRDNHSNNDQTRVRHTDVYVSDHHRGDRYHDDRRTEMIQVASPEQVEMILSYIKGVTFDKEKLKAAILCVKLCPIQSADIARIVNAFTFDDSKKEFLKTAYPFCPDPQNYHIAVDKLTFSSSRDEVYRCIRR